MQPSFGNNCDRIRPGTSSPKFSTIWQSAPHKPKIHTALIWLQLRPEFGPAHLSVGCMIEAVRSANKTIDIDNVNRVLLQPHWQKETDLADF